MKNPKNRFTRLDHVTLAEGEVTGHSHQAVGGTLYDAGAGALVLERGTQTEIRHEEHHGVLLPGEAGDLFDVRKVQEYDHAAEAARNVAD